MSTRLLDLEDRIITDTGAMVAKHNLLVQMALAGEQFDHLPFEAHPDVDRYHHYRGSKQTALRWKEDGEIRGPAPGTFDWRTPEPYASLSIADLCEGALEDRGLVSDEYRIRLRDELGRIEQKQMHEFLRCLVWITDTMRKNGVLWGLGRGSSCASLVLFLLEVNKVDPVKYDIPMEEFYK